MRIPQGLARFLSRAHHSWHVLNRINTVVVLGLFILLGSHWLDREAEARWARELGTAAIVFAYTRWVTQQGKRRTDGSGSQVRPITIQFGADKTAEIRRKIARKHARGDRE